MAKLHFFFESVCRKMQKVAKFAHMKRLILLFALACGLSVGARADGRPEVAVLGDSYSTFEGCVEPAGNAVWYFNGGHEHSDVREAGQTWWRILTDDPSAGLRLGVNNSYSGATICNTGYEGADYSDRSFITRMNNLGNPDIILVFGATNDSWAGSPVGEYIYSDWTPARLYSFRPALARLFYGLRELYPDAEVWFILNSDLKPEIVGSVETISARYGVPVIALHDIEKDWGHPTAAGMRAIAAQVKKALTPSLTQKQK